MVIRAAIPSDVPEIVAMIRELADYERAADEAVATEDQLHRALFGDAPAVFALVAAREHVDIEVNGSHLAGIAIWFLNFSTWLGSHGVYLEDLYVRPAFRSQGHGKALLVELARICVDRGYRRLEWWVLDWNEPAIGFYRSIGAQPMAEWTVHRLTGEALGDLGMLGKPAERPSGSPPAVA